MPQTPLMNVVISFWREKVKSHSIFLCDVRASISICTRPKGHKKDVSYSLCLLMMINQNDFISSCAAAFAHIFMFHFLVVLQMVDKHSAVSANVSACVSALSLSASFFTVVAAAAAAEVHQYVCKLYTHHASHVRQQPHAAAAGDETIPSNCAHKSLSHTRVRVATPRAPQNAVRPLSRRRWWHCFFLWHVLACFMRTCG